MKLPFYDKLLDRLKIAVFREMYLQEAYSLWRKNF